MRILISACLIGRPVRYDGGSKDQHSDILSEWMRSGIGVPFCPEDAAGLPTPRQPVEIEPGQDGRDVLIGRARIVDAAGEDETEAYRRGAELALEFARAQRCSAAVLTDGSPSCGPHSVHDGTFTGRKKSGLGVVAALLRENGLKLFSEHEISEAAAWLDGQSCRSVPR